jgi:hypothetical protein
MPLLDITNSAPVSSSLDKYNNEISKQRLSKAKEQVVVVAETKPPPLAAAEPAAIYNPRKFYKLPMGREAPTKNAHDNWEQNLLCRPIGFSIDYLDGFNEIDQRSTCLLCRGCPVQSGSEIRHCRGRTHRTAYALLRTLAERETSERACLDQHFIVKNGQEVTAWKCTACNTKSLSHEYMLKHLTGKKHEQIVMSRFFREDRYEQSHESFSVTESVHASRDEPCFLCLTGQLHIQCIQGNPLSSTDTNQCVIQNMPVFAGLDSESPYESDDDSVCLSDDPNLARVLRDYLDCSSPVAKPLAQNVQGSGGSDIDPLLIGIQGWPKSDGSFYDQMSALTDNAPLFSIFSSYQPEYTDADDKPLARGDISGSSSTGLLSDFSSLSTIPEEASPLKNLECNHLQGDPDNSLDFLLFQEETNTCMKALEALGL